MARQAAKKKSAGNSARTESKVFKALILIPLAAFLFKMTVISKLQQLGYAGSDFENYFNATNGLLKDGLFSKYSVLPGAISTPWSHTYCNESGNTP